MAMVYAPIVKSLSNISDADIVGLNIPTGIPLIYEFDDNLQPVKNYYLADKAELEAAQQAVANQGKGKNLIIQLFSPFL